MLAVKQCSVVNDKQRAQLSDHLLPSLTLSRLDAVFWTVRGTSSTQSALPCLAMDMVPQQSTQKAVPKCALTRPATSRRLAVASPARACPLHLRPTLLRLACHLCYTRVHPQTHAHYSHHRAGPHPHRSPASPPSSSRSPARCQSLPPRLPSRSARAMTESLKSRLASASRCVLPLLVLLHSPSRSSSLAAKGPFRKGQPTLRLGGHSQQLAHERDTTDRAHANVFRPRRRLTSSANRPRLSTSRLPRPPASPARSPSSSSVRSR